jgi:hypothetical protein
MLSPQDRFYMPYSLEIPMILTRRKTIEELKLIFLKYLEEFEDFIASQYDGYRKMLINCSFSRGMGENTLPFLQLDMRDFGILHTWYWSKKIMPLVKKEDIPISLKCKYVDPVDCEFNDYIAKTEFFDESFYFFHSDRLREILHVVLKDYPTATVVSKFERFSKVGDGVTCLFFPKDDALKQIGENFLIITPRDYYLGSIFFRETGHANGYIRTNIPGYLTIGNLSHYFPKKTEFLFDINVWKRYEKFVFVDANALAYVKQFNLLNIIQPKRMIFNEDLGKEACYIWSGTGAIDPKYEGYEIYNASIGRMIDSLYMKCAFPFMGCVESSFLHKIGCSEVVSFPHRYEKEKEMYCPVYERIGRVGFPYLIKGFASASEYIMQGFRSDPENYKSYPYFEDWHIVIFKRSGHVRYHCTCRDNAYHKGGYHNHLVKIVSDEVYGQVALRSWTDTLLCSYPRIFSKQGVLENESKMPGGRRTTKALFAHPHLVTNGGYYFNLYGIKEVYEKDWADIRHYCRPAYRKDEHPYLQVKERKEKTNANVSAFLGKLFGVVRMEKTRCEIDEYILKSHPAESIERIRAWVRKNKIDTVITEKDEYDDVED